MSFTFAQIPFDVIKLICSFISGRDLLRLERVEKHLHQLMSSRSFWIDPQISTRQLKRQRVLASTPYHLQLYFQFYTMDHPDAIYDIESFDLSVIKASLVASRILDRYHPKRDIFSITPFLKLLDGIILNGDQVEPLIDSVVITTEDSIYQSVIVNLEQDEDISIRLGSTDVKDQPIYQHVKKYLRVLEELIPEEL